MADQFYITSYPIISKYPKQEKQYYYKQFVGANVTLVINDDANQIGHLRQFNDKTSHQQMLPIKDYVPGNFECLVFEIYLHSYGDLFHYKHGRQFQQSLNPLKQQWKQLVKQMHQKKYFGHPITRESFVVDANFQPKLRFFKLQTDQSKINQLKQKDNQSLNKIFEVKSQQKKPE